jgi:microcystin-dependent protein
MRKLIAAACCAVLLCFATGASAEIAADQPTKFQIPWGNGAGGAYIRPIPQASQIPSQNCAASLTDGFPPLTFTPAGAGGCPPFGQDFNGIFKQLSQWSRWNAMGTPTFYDSVFSAGIGGYPKWTALSNATTPGCYWISQVDSNVTNPDAGGAGWLSSCTSTGNTGTSTGSANLQVVTSPPFAVQSGLPTVGSECSYIAGFTNTAALQVNCNTTANVTVYRRSQLGATATVGGEIVTGQLVTLKFDGTHWQCMTCAFVWVGQEMDFKGTAAQLPLGWLPEDGTCHIQSSFADLFTVVGTTYGSCSAGNFGLPDMRGNAGVALDNQGSNGNAGRLSNCGNDTTLGAACGAQQQALTSTNQMPPYTPAGSVVVTLISNTGLAIYGGNQAKPLGTGNAVVLNAGSANVGVASAIFTGTPVGSSSPFTIIQPVVFTYKLIKY